MRRNAISYANVMSTAGVFLALGGTSYAAVKITGKSIKNGTVTSADIKDHSLRAVDFRSGQLPRGATGPAGPEGPQGATGPGGAAGTVASGGGAADASAPIGRLKLTGINGDGPGGTFTVRSIDWHNTATVGAGGGNGGGTGKVTFNDLELTKPADSASPELWKRVTSGLHLTSGTLELLSPGAASPYATLAVEDVAITRAHPTGATGDLTDDLHLAFHINASTAATPTLTVDPSAPTPAASAPQLGTIALEGIAGASPVYAQSWDVTAPAQGGAGKPTFTEFTVRKALGADSPELLKRFRSGVHVKSATVELQRPGVATTYVLEDVTLTGYRLSGASKDLEEIGLTAAKIHSTTTTPAGGQPVTACYDIKTTASC